MFCGNSSFVACGFQLTWLRLRNLTLRGLGAGVLCAQSLAHDVTQQPTPPRQNLTNGDVADDGDGRRSSFYRQTLDDLRQQYRAAADACKACRVPEVSSGNTTSLCFYCHRLLNAASLTW